MDSQHGSTGRGEALDVESTLAALAALPSLEYEKLRKQEAERLGCRVGTLDGQVAHRRQVAEATQSQGKALALRSQEPWPKPVSGAEVLADLARVLTRHVCLERGCATAIALWILHTHLFSCAQISPRLAVVSPEKRCGKSTLLTVLGGIVPKALHVANITAAAVFRCVEAAQPTLLIDEADTFVDGKEDLRGILNSGHNKATAFVVRVVGDEQEPRVFSTWAPVAIAAIGKLPDTLMDRSVVISMRRKMPSEKIDRLRLDRMGHLHDLGRRCARWAADNSLKVMDQEPEVPDFISDRAADNWRTLLTIAEAVGEGWPDRARRAIRELNGEPEEGDDGSIRETLLRDIQIVFDGVTSGTITTEQLLNRLLSRTFADHPWSTFVRGRPMTPRGLASLLKPFGIRPKNLKIGGAVLKGYDRSAFLDPFRRYIPEISATTAISNNISTLHDNLSATGIDVVAVEYRCNSLILNEVAWVADKTGDAVGGGNSAAWVEV